MRGRGRRRGARGRREVTQEYEEEGMIKAMGGKVEGSVVGSDVEEREEGGKERMANGGKGQEG